VEGDREEYFCYTSKKMFRWINTVTLVLAEIPLLRRLEDHLCQLEQEALVPHLPLEEEPNVLPFGTETVLGILKKAAEMAQGKAKEELELLVSREAPKEGRHPTYDELLLATWTFGNFTIFATTPHVSPGGSHASSRVDDAQAIPKVPQVSPPVREKVVKVAPPAAPMPQETVPKSKPHVALPHSAPPIVPHINPPAAITLPEPKDAPATPAIEVPETKVPSAIAEPEDSKEQVKLSRVTPPETKAPVASTPQSKTESETVASVSSVNVEPMERPHGAFAQKKVGPKSRTASEGTEREKTKHGKKHKAPQLLQEFSVDPPASYTAWTPDKDETPAPKASLASFSFDDDDDEEKNASKTKNVPAKASPVAPSQHGSKKHKKKKSGSGDPADFVANLYDSAGHLPKQYTTWEPSDDTPKTSPSIEAMKAAFEEDDDASLLQVRTRLRGAKDYRRDAASILLEAYASALHSEALHQLALRFKRPPSTTLLKHISTITATALPPIQDSLPPPAEQEQKAWRLCEYFHSHEAIRVTDQRRALLQVHDALVAAQDAVVAVKRMQANTEELPTNFDGAGAWRDKTLMWIREKEVEAREQLKVANQQFTAENNKAEPLRDHLDHIRAQCTTLNSQAKRERDEMEIQAMREALGLLNSHQ